MDLKLYYQKIRDMEAKIADAFPIVVSLETPDGGKEGTKTEVPRRIAAKMIVEGIVHLAKEEEARVFRALQLEAVRVAEQIAAAAKVQLAVLTSAELDKLKGAANSSKDKA
jgi:hypothetical protein